MIPLRELGQLLPSIGPILKRALVSGQIFRPACELTAPDPDVDCAYDVEIPLRDGTLLTANVFRSKRALAAGQAQPVVMCAHPYDNHLIPALGRTPLGGPPHQYRLIPQAGRPAFSTLTSWESPDPNFWIPAGYAVVNMNLPGFANSGGKPSFFSTEQADAFAQAIDWIGAQAWCTGSVGLNGVSFLAISQYAVASGETPHGVPRFLKAICPWEGIRDLYQEMFFEGGVEERGFPVFWWHTEVKPTINCSEEELVAIEGQKPQDMAEAHPFYDAYWKSKVARVADIDLPMLICASFSDQGLHTRGSFGIFREARSRRKWVYTHRSLKWDAYYARDVQELTRRFFDRFVKGEENGFDETPAVRLEVRSERDVVHEVRFEQSWPLERTRYEKLYLTGAGRLDPTPDPAPSELSYDARRGSLEVRHVFSEDTELTGYMKLRLWVEARPTGASPPPTDMVLFAGVDKLGAGGERMRFYGSVGNHADLLSRGLLAVSRRALDEARSSEWEPCLRNDRDQPLQPGEIVRVEIALQPSSTFFRSGEGLAVTISPNEIVPSPPYVKANGANRGLHVLHVGGPHDAHLLIPIIPRAAEAG